MENQASAWRSQIDELTEKFQGAFSTLSYEELFTKPNSETWSIGENLLHLIKVNSSYFPLFQQLLDKTYRPAWSGRFRFIYATIGNAILKSVSEGRKKKIKTFKTWEPIVADTSEDILNLFVDQQQELKQWLEKLQPMFGKEVVINSPVNKMISYTLDQAIEIMLAHEERHFHQAMEVKEAMGHKKNLQA